MTRNNAWIYLLAVWKIVDIFGFIIEWIIK